MTDDTIQSAYTDHVEALKLLGSSLSAAVAVRFEAPPSMITQPSLTGVSNPTLDIVLDARRSDVSDAVNRAARDLRRMSAVTMEAHTKLLAVIDRWEGTHSGE